MSKSVMNAYAFCCAKEDSIDTGPSDPVDYIHKIDPHVLAKYVKTFRIKTAPIEEELLDKVKSFIQLNKYHNMLIYHEAFQLDFSIHFDLESILRVMVQKDKTEDAE